MNEGVVSLFLVLKKKAETAVMPTSPSCLAELSQIDLGNGVSVKY